MGQALTVAQGLRPELADSAARKPQSNPSPTLPHEHHETSRAIRIQPMSVSRLEFPSDGSLHVEGRVPGLGKIVRWILGYGDQVEVVAPQGIRNMIAPTCEVPRRDV